MHASTSESLPPAAQPCDVLIIGSGAGGAAAAFALVEAGLSVVVVERGPRLPDDESVHSPQAVLREGRFKSKEAWQDADGKTLVPEEYFNVGGKTRWYGAALLRYAPEEFAGDAAQALLPWPIAYADLEPYYQRAEALLGIQTRPAEPALAGILDGLRGDGWEADPLPLGLAPALFNNPLDTHFDGFALPNGLKADAQHRLLDRLHGRANFELLTSAEVSALMPDARTPTRIAGVQLADGRVLMAGTVMLAAGALHSPRLLQRYFRAQQLDEVLPASRSVGRNFKRHLLTAVMGFALRPQGDRVRKTRLITHARFAHSSVQPLGGWVDREIVRLTVPAFVPGFIREWFARRVYGFFLQTEDGSSADNRVHAPDGAPPQLHYDAQKLPQWREHRAFVSAFMFSLLKTGRLPFRKSIPLEGTAHACGTLVMGNDPEHSVVDTEGRVHGMDNLYVVDGSVLPRSGRMNPALTIYAWGLRTAEHLAARLASSAEPALPLPNRVTAP